jgi:hypothetical protein
MARPLASLNLNLLVSLDALLQECSVTRAAKLTGVTQSAMSHTLAALRDHFGDPLLARGGRGMELTPRARQLARPPAACADRAGADCRGRAAFRPREYDPAVPRRDGRLRRRHARSLAMSSARASGTPRSSRDRAVRQAHPGYRSRARISRSGDRAAKRCRRRALPRDATRRSLSLRRFSRSFARTCGSAHSR